MKKLPKHSNTDGKKEQLLGGNMSNKSQFSYPVPAQIVLGNTYFLFPSVHYIVG